MIGQTLAQCIIKCIHTCGMHGRELVDCILMMLRMK